MDCRAQPDTDKDVLGRRYDPTGAPIGGEFRVNVYTTSYQLLPSIASDSSGAFVVVWVGSGGQDGHGVGILGQRFDSSGTRLGAEFVVNSYTTGNQIAPAVAMDAAGNFVVVWRSAPVGGNPAFIAGQRFTRDGLRIGSEFQVTASGTGLPHYPSLAVAPGGEFVVAWSDSTDVPTKLKVRRYDASGVPRDSEFVAHNFAQTGWWVPALASYGDGRFVVLWPELEAPPSPWSDLEGRRFDAAGAPRGRVFRANTATTGNQGVPAVAADAAGNLLVAWSSTHEEGTAFNVYAQGYRALTPHALTIDPVGGPYSNGNGVLEPGEIVDVRPAWENHSGGVLALWAWLTGITGPPGPFYGIVDPDGAYGIVPDSVIQACLNCYAVMVTAPPIRPALHWDARATEVLNSDREGHNEWVFHVGDSFTDVPRTNPFYRFVETLLHDGVTGGCTADAYCPGASTTREQMAPFVLIAKEGAGYTPPACSTPVFGDVPASSPFCRWIEELARRGVVTGCGGGNYCPTAPVTREQMSVFLTATFGVTLYGP